MTEMTAWQPTCGLAQLRLRARLLAAIRQFFAQRDVLEVETPLLCHTTGTDPQLDFFATEYRFLPHRKSLFLQTSPEFAMKRLLAAGSGSIYQICKAFRNGESGRYHNPEFTMLEWYRLDFDLPQFMAEVGELLSELLAPRLPFKKVEQFSYSALFKEITGLNPLVFSSADYQNYALSQDLPEAESLCGDDHALWLDLLFSLKIQPQLGWDSVCLVHGYPAFLPSLARVNRDNPLIVDRFEVFVAGIELGNGFFELADVDEQNRRFEQEILERQAKNLPPVQKDNALLAALAHGLPDCSGVAIGLDRVLMLLDQSQSIEDILAFPVAVA
jgi:lysyl-tRNA synthetase class 2